MFPKSLITSFSDLPLNNMATFWECRVDRNTRKGYGEPNIMYKTNFMRECL